MDKKRLLEKLEELEWEDFEVKEARNSIPKNSFETVSAFANTSGGWLVFGVKQSGKKFEITGIEDPEKIEQDFTTALRGEKFNQKIQVSSKRYSIDGKTILAFYIPASEKKPVYFNSRKNAFIRTGSGDQRATDVEIDAMYRDSAFGTKDRELTNFLYEDLDQKTVEDYKIYLGNVNPEHRYNKLSSKALLEKLQVIVNGKVTVGGLLIFGTEDNINRMLTDFRIDYLEILGTSYSDAPTRYNYRLSEEENLFRFYFSIFERLIKKIELPFTLRPDGFATDRQPQLAAVREALVNLLMHSDYFSPMKPRIRVFLDRIEFMNPGPLPKDLESIMKEDFSMPRNPTIARIFRAIKLSENAGSGFDKMFTGWKAHYGIEPIVSEGIDFYKIEFPLKNEIPERETIQKEPETKEKTGEKTREKTREKIISLIKEKPEVTINELAEKLNISVKGVEWQIRNLKEQGALKRIGPDKGGYWEIIEK